jgi:hypothetical protein
LRICDDGQLREERHKRFEPCPSLSHAPASMNLSDLFGQLLRHRLFAAQHPTKIGGADAKQLREFISAANVMVWTAPARHLAQ